MAKTSFDSQRHPRRWLFFRFISAGCLGLLLASLWHAGLARGVSVPLPERSYPLPDRLEAVLERRDSGVKDYLDQISPSPQGYLLWSVWPVKVYVESVQSAPNTALGQRQLSWQTQAEAAIADWSQYLPLVTTGDRAQANIVILRQQPPLRWGSGQLGRARHAETRFRIVADRDRQGNACLRHRQTVYVGDRQGPVQLRGTLRHELGHALGLWGHSPEPDDVLYEGQVANPPAISQRDLNTLGKLYGQPTRLGCLGDLP